MKKIVSILLIVLGIGLGLYGLNQMSESTASVEIGPLELSATDQEKQTRNYVLIGAGAIMLIGGLITYSKK